MKNQYLKILLLFFILCFVESSAQSIIVNVNNPIASISKGKLRNVFLGNSNTWENGVLIQVADYHSTNNLRIKFSENLLDISPRKVSMIWIKVTLSGKSIPPKIFRDEKEAIEFVAQNEGAIAYVENAENLPSQVKTIEIE